MLTGIQGAVTVTNDFGLSTLAVNATADLSQRTATLDRTGLNGRLTGLGNTAAILYAASDTASVTVNLSNLGNTLFLNQGNFSPGALPDDRELRDRGRTR